MTSRADTTRFSPIGAITVSITRVASSVPAHAPSPLDRIGSAGLAGLGHPAVDREPVTARELRKQLPESMTEQLLAVKANQRAIGVIDELVAEIDDLAARTANR